MVLQVNTQIILSKLVASGVDQLYTAKLYLLPLNIVDTIFFFVYFIYIV